MSDADLDDDVSDPFDTREIFDLLRDINDPEHPLTLEQLNVVTEDQVTGVGPDSYWEWSGHVKIGKRYILCKIPWVGGDYEQGK